MTALIAALMAIAAAASNIFTSGTRWGSVVNSLNVIGERLSVIERQVDASQTGTTALEIQVRLLEQRITGLERREGANP